MVFPLPTSCLLRSSYNNKYLSYISDETAAKRFLQFSGDDVGSPSVKFLLETSTSDNDFVHIRCCYNNKYLVRQSEEDKWIVAAHEKQEEDQSKWSCTLFKIIYVDDNARTLRFLHMQLGNYACLWRGDQPIYGCLIAGWDSPNQDLCDVFSIIDWDSLVILPKYVAFKGDNGKYLRDMSLMGIMIFLESDVGSAAVRNEIINNPDGSIRIKYLSNNQILMRNDNNDLIYLKPDNEANNKPDAFFLPIKIDDDVIVLRNLGNNNLCCRNDDKTFGANAHKVTQATRLQVEEVVISRKIYNVNYRLDDVRIYNETILTMDSASANNDSDQSNDFTFTFTYKEGKSSTWRSSVSLKLGMSIEFNTGIPIIFEFKVQLSGELQETYEWGKTKESETELQSTYKVIVAPRTKVKVYMLATQGTCDVPFSYHQFDTYTDGRQVITAMDDGVYTGVNCYNFTYKVVEEKI